MRRLALYITLLSSVGVSYSQGTFEEKTKGSVKVEGLFTTFQNQKENKVFLEIRPDQFREFLYVTAIRTGLGSNDIGLDRGRLGGTRVVRIRRVADKVLFQVPNLAFRSEGAGRAEAQAVKESFAESVLWAGTVAAEREDGTVLVDISSLLLADSNDVAGALSGTKEGTASVDGARSAIDFENCKSFPKNLEFETLLTFKVTGAGRFVRSTVPIPESWSIVQRTSLIELPDDKYRRRAFNPRVGAFGVSYQDYAVPLSESIQKRFVARHRLVASAKEPIVYYVDNGAPEPIRSALVEGAGWWAKAFEAAGFKDAFRVEVMPRGMDPLDARYNVIQWVHRSTRGWSYGGSVTDPRTGEIIKGHVTLGSLRVRQDRMIFEGLLGTQETGTGSPIDPVQLSLARIRQLAAHEVGHTLGLAHNFAGSCFERGSVMDYPAPRVGVKDGRLDVSDAYGVGVGAYDVTAIRWLYSEFATDAEEKAGLDNILNEARRDGQVFLSDADCRSLGACDPRGSLWDDGPDPVSALRNSMRVREIAIKDFGRDRLKPGEPASDLASVFVPVYLHHRYQVEAAVKQIGGVYYDHDRNSNDTRPLRRVAAGDQLSALDALLDCLDAKFLTVPDAVTDVLPPPTFGTSPTIEQFSSRTEPAFDPVSAAESAAQIVLNALMEPSRMERLAQQSEHQIELPSLNDVLQRVTDRIFPSQIAKQGSNNVLWAVRRLYMDRLLQIDADTDLTFTVRSSARQQIVRILDRLKGPLPEQDLMYDEVTRILSRPAGTTLPKNKAIAVPPGSPIGDFGECSLGG